MTKSSRGFLDEYFRVCQNTNPDRITDWLRANAKRMTEEMFSEVVAWGCSPLQTLLLRAYAPEDVFTEDAREKYPELVGGDEALEELVDALFGDDDDLTDYLPPSLEMLRDFLMTCQDDARRRGIR